MPGKLYTLIFAISLLTAQWISAADNMWVGLRSGPSIPRLSGGNNEVSRGFSTILAPNFGVVAMYELNSHVAIQTELDYSGQGGERKGLQPITIEAGGLPPLQPGQYLYADFRNRSVLNYLELPVMARYQRNFTGRWRYFFQGGPYIGYLLNAEERTRGSSQIFVDKNRTPLTIEGQPLPPVSFYANTDIAGDLQKFNWGITGGVGVSYLIGDRHQIFMDIRGEYGLRSVQKHPERDGKSNTGAATLSVGYLFNLGR